MFEKRPILKSIIDKINEHHPLTEIDAGEFSEMKAPMMKFSIKAYKAEGLGHVSVMSMSGMFGLMKMDTVIINPKERDLPLLSYDRVYAAGKDTLIVELYDTRANIGELPELRAVATETGSLPQNDLGEHWYDSIKLPESVSLKAGKSLEGEFDKVAEKMLSAYLKTVTAPDFDGAVKAEKSTAYVEGLLTNGGPSTSVFKKFFGEEKTANLFRTILFGTNK